jgi:outer membrane protein OmpA-like peptidoglycan-associated protein
MKFIQFAICLSLIPSSVALALDSESVLNQSIDQLCSTDDWVVTHKSTIIQAHHTQWHDRGELKTISPLESDLMALLDPKIINLGDDCIEYLSSQKLVSLEAGEMLARVYFDFNRSDLTQASKKTLHSLAARLQNSDSSLQVVGHTDDIGSESFNLTLGEKRSMSAVEQMVERGVDAERLEARTGGEATPIADNTTEEGRAKNRRVEIFVQ